MMELKEILMDIRKELRASDKYAREAVKHKKEFPALSDVYHRIAVDNMAHVEMLGKHAKEMAEKHGMMGLWEVEDFMIRHDTNEVKRCLDNYRD